MAEQITSAASSRLALGEYGALVDRLRQAVMSAYKIQKGELPKYSADERTALVKLANTAIHPETLRSGWMGAQANGSQTSAVLARELTNTMASIEGPDADNPFEGSELENVYANAQRWAAHIEGRGNRADDLQHLLNVRATLVDYVEMRAMALHDAQLIESQLFEQSQTDTNLVAEHRAAARAVRAESKTFKSAIDDLRQFRANPTPDPALRDVFNEVESLELVIEKTERSMREAEQAGLQPDAEYRNDLRHAHDTLKAHLSTHGGYISVNSDEMRTRLPFYDELDPHDPDFSSKTQADAGALAQAVQREAIAHRRNIIIDGTLRDPEAAEELAETLRTAGYRVELHALSVNDQISYQRAAARYERDAAAGIPGRLVPKGWHDQAYQGVARSVRRLEYRAAVDSIVVYNRLGDAIHSGRPTGGSVAAGTTLERARNQLSDFERVSLAASWDAINESLHRRDATLSYRSAVRPQLERAHYTLRQSAQAAAQYDREYPAEKHQSRELASAYGKRLSEAYVQAVSIAPMAEGGRHELMIQYPELQDALQARSLAILDAGRRTPDESDKHLREQDRRIRACLEAGERVQETQRPSLHQELSRLKKNVRDIVDSFELCEAAGMSVTAEDRRELSEAQKQLDTFVRQNAAQLTRSTPQGGAQTHVQREAAVEAPTAPRPG